MFAPSTAIYTHGLGLSQLIPVVSQLGAFHTFSWVGRDRMVVGFITTYAISALSPLTL